MASIKVKILLIFFAILSFAMVGVVYIIRAESAKWFEEDANTKIATGELVIRAKLDDVEKNQAAAVDSIIKHEEINTSLLLLADLVSEDIDELFDDAYIEMAKLIAEKLENIGSNAQLNTMIVTANNGTLISYYSVENTESVIGWYAGADTYFKKEGQQIISDSDIPTSITSVLNTKLEKNINQTLMINNNVVHSYSTDVLELGMDEDIKLGNIYSVFSYDNQFAQHLAELSGISVNFYSNGNISTGSLINVSSINQSILNNLDSEKENIITKITTTDDDYYAFVEKLNQSKNQDILVAGLYSSSRAQSRLTNATNLLVLVGFITVIIGSFITFILVNILLKPLTVLSTIVSQVKDRGDFSLRANINSKDEVGLTVLAFNGLMDTLHQSINDINNVMDGVAKGDLTQRIEANTTGDLNQLANNINHSLDTMQATLKILSKSTNILNEQIINLSRSSETVQRSSDKQVESLNHVSSALNDTSAAISDVAKNTEKAYDDAQQAVMVVSQGKQKVDQVVCVVEKIRKNNESISDNVCTIQNIAAQTNLLALNAAIEAARAGEQGRGFAVVADEVRALAAHASQAAEEITSLVSEAVNISSDGVKAAKEANTDMENIASAVTRTEEKLILIATAMEEQDQTVHGINQTFENLKVISDENSIAAKHINSAFIELGNIAEENNTQIRSFKVS